MKITNGSVTIPLTELEKIKSTLAKKDLEIDELKEKLKKTNIAVKEFAKGESIHVVYETNYMNGYSDMKITTTDDMIAKLVVRNNKLTALIENIRVKVSEVSTFNKKNVINKIKKLVNS